MALNIFQVDAFASQLFAGNPAAILRLQKFLSERLMQSIAAENNLAETAFIVQRHDKGYDLRWFTPLAEIEFCGHATIASAHVLIAEEGIKPPVVFHTQIGVLTVEVSNSGYVLQAPNYSMQPICVDEIITNAVGGPIIGAYIARNNLYVELSDAQSVFDHQPNMASITKLLKVYSQNTKMGMSIMAPGSGKFAQYDFVSRHYAPLHGVPEDPVTGSAHSALAPFWAARLDKTNLIACQCSARGGVLYCEVAPNCVRITGQAITYLRGKITIPA